MSFKKLLALKEQLFLTYIGDKGDNRLLAEICVGGHRRLPKDIMGKHVDEIASMPTYYTKALYYEFRWDRYFTFMVRDEGFAAVREDEEFTGFMIRRFEKSWLLTMIPELSNGLHGITGGRAHLQHFGLCCLNHIVDILAYDEPIIRDLGLRELDPKMPNHPTEPTPSAVTRPAGQAARQSP
jgi:hypothetical protein